MNLSGVKFNTCKGDLQTLKEIIAMKNYTKTNIGNDGRVKLHEALGLTGAEVSINRLPKGAGVPFVQRAFHPHHVDDRREVIFQIVVVALSPYADAGNKFIFHNKILLCKYIVPQRRKKQKCAFQNNCKKPGSIG